MTWSKRRSILPIAAIAPPGTRVGWAHALRGCGKLPWWVAGVLHCKTRREAFDSATERAGVCYANHQPPCCHRPMLREPSRSSRSGSRGPTHRHRSSVLRRGDRRGPRGLTRFDPPHVTQPAGLVDPSATAVAPFGRAELFAQRVVLVVQLESRLPAAVQDIRHAGATDTQLASQRAVRKLARLPEPSDLNCQIHRDLHHRAPIQKVRRRPRRHSMARPHRPSRGRPRRRP